MDNINLNFAEARRRLNLTLEEVSLKTKIRPHILATLEEGNYTFLPAVYIISFVKTYASFLKYPESVINEAIEQISKLTKYEKPPVLNIPKSNVTELEKQPFSFKNLKKTKLPNLNQSNLVNYILYTAVGLALIAIVYIAFFMGSSKTSSFQGEVGTVRPDTALIKNNDKKLNDFFDGQDSIVLEAKGIDTAWLRINIDGAESQQFLIVPKFEKSWVAKKFIILSLGNAGAVEFKRDGNVLPPFGTKGNVIRNVKITKNQVISSSNPWAATKDSSNKAAVIKKPNPKKQIKKTEEPRLIEPAEFQQTSKPFEKKK